MEERNRKILTNLIAIILVILIVIIFKTSDGIEFQCSFSMGSNTFAAIIIAVFSAMIVIEIIKKR